MSRIRNISVRVTPLDIRRGVRKEVKSCPLARALRRRFKGDLVYVSNLSASVGARFYTFDDDTVRRIDQYDLGETLEPFTAKLTLQGRLIPCFAT